MGACPSLVAYITAACGTAGSCTGKVNAKGIAIGASRDPTAKEVAAICTEFRRTAGGCANAASNKILTKGCPATKHATPTMETATAHDYGGAAVGALLGSAGGLGGSLIGAAIGGAVSGDGGGYSSGGDGGNSGYSSGGYVTYDHGENAQAAAP